MKKLSKTALTLIIISFMVTITLVVVSVFTYVTPFSEKKETGEGTAKNDVKFSVYYIDNNIFEKTKRPADYYFLMSFTDYIEIENSFTAEFNIETEITYRYNVAEKLIIKHNQNGESSSKVVFGETFPISKIEGSKKGRKISFKGNDDPGGIYIVDPKKYIDIYRNFVIEHQKQMERENVTPQKIPDFSAELSVEFTYNIRNEERGINQTMTRIITIPLSSEVFQISITGEPSVEISFNTPKTGNQKLWVIIMFVALFVLQIFGVSYFIRKSIEEPDEYIRKFNIICKKYSDEIVYSLDPFDLSEHIVISVGQFKELLKMSLILGKCIICYHDEKKAEFCIFSDGYAFCCGLYSETGSYHTTSGNYAGDETEPTDSADTEPMNGRK